MDPMEHADGGIVVIGARTNNLKDVSLTIPKKALTAFVGVSGSGKSSLVLDTVAVESQRQLNETFPSFVRSRLARLERPKAEALKNLSTAVVVDQRPPGENSRSTVGTMTEVNPVLRVLFSRHGEPCAGPSNAYSFNDPHGMCPRCEGLGRITTVEPEALVDDTKTLNEGALTFPAFAVGTAQWQQYAESGLFDPDKPIAAFTAEERELLLHGSGLSVQRRTKHSVFRNEYEGVVTRFTRRFIKRDTPLRARERENVERVVSQGPCTDCGGTRLNPAALDSRIGPHNLADYCATEVGDLIGVLEGIDDPVAKPVAHAALEILRHIESIGLGYLSLDRGTSTVSGGEGQRLKTVRHLGSSLTDIVYVFDEPSAGLHPRDISRLTGLLHGLRDKGNTVLVVEHDRAVLDAADHVVELGPGPGARGGHIVFEGTPRELRDADTVTGRCRRRTPHVNKDPRTAHGAISIRGAGLHNLRDVSVDVPTEVLTVVTGVAGSGKSTLISGVLAAQCPDTVLVDQSATGISSRATLATYLGIMDTVRKLFARAGCVDASLFSFNSEGGCPACRGRGVIRTDLAFLDPVTVICEECEGLRYRPEALTHRLGPLNVVEVLALTVEDAREFFAEHASAERNIADRLYALQEAGLGYLTLGQPLSTLSGGERQRLKLAGRLREQGGLYLFDEPTTGLHMADVTGLLTLIDRLVDGGNTVVVVEHDLDVVRHADWVIDLGPGPGQDGGRVVFEGPPAALLDAEDSVTAEYLRGHVQHQQGENNRDT